MRKEPQFTVSLDSPSYPFQRMDIRNQALVEIFDGFLSTFRPSIVCDVGAFNGNESYRFLQILPDAHVFAFEASPKNFSQFYVESNRFNDFERFKVENVAVSDFVGELSFNQLEAEDDAADWRRAASSILPRIDGSAAKTVTIPCTTLDEYFSGIDIRKQTFALWIDVEGALDKVIAGAHSVLDRTLFLKAELEYKEFWEGQVLSEELIGMIEEKGFWLVGNSHLPLAYDQSDAIFINRRLLELYCGT